MDHDLIERMEPEMEERRPERPSSLYGHSAVHAAGKNVCKGFKVKKNTPEHEGGVAGPSSRFKNGVENIRGRSSDILPETVVAVFPPSDIEIYGSRRVGDVHPYYAGDATISSIKCVMSTILFLAVVAAIVVVAFVKNPGM
jgi:hypothetical protein